MVTVSPVLAELGEKLSMVGSKLNPGVEKKLKPHCVAVPPGVNTDTSPDEPAPTTALMTVDDICVKDVALIPPNLTKKTDVKFVP